MEIPLFPLNMVLFPNMVIPLHIFEPRYREMINHCITNRIPFGVVLRKSAEKPGELITPHEVGTTARITKVDRLSDGRINITAVGAQRFRIQELDRDRFHYIMAQVTNFPVINGSTRRAVRLAYEIRPRLMEYIEMLAKATRAELHLRRLPQDPSTLAFLIAIVLQVNNEDKQRLLALAGVPEILYNESRMLGRELLLLQYMIETQPYLDELTSGPTGYLFMN